MKIVSKRILQVSVYSIFFNWHLEATLLKHLTVFPEVAIAAYIGFKFGSAYHGKQGEPVDRLIEKFIRDQLRLHGNRSWQMMNIKKHTDWAVLSGADTLFVNFSDHDCLHAALYKKSLGENLSAADKEKIETATMIIAHEHDHCYYHHCLKKCFFIASCAYSFLYLCGYHASKSSFTIPTSGIVPVRHARSMVFFGGGIYGAHVAFNMLSRYCERQADRYALKTATSLSHLTALSNFFKQHHDTEKKLYRLGYGRSVLRQLHWLAGSKKSFVDWMDDHSSLVSTADFFSLSASHPSDKDRMALIDAYVSTYKKQIKS